jgi:hypothetical protein
MNNVWFEKATGPKSLFINSIVLLVVVVAIISFALSRLFMFSEERDNG